MEEEPQLKLQQKEDQRSAKIWKEEQVVEVELSP